jgi:hypothetical protein
MFPKTGNSFHFRSERCTKSEFDELIADALKQELSDTHQAVKTIRRWTGVSERTAKYWLDGTHGPCAVHLAALAEHSDAVLVQFLTVARREELLEELELSALCAKLRDLVRAIERRVH